MDVCKSRFDRSFVFFVGHEGYILQTSVVVVSRREEKKESSASLRHTMMVVAAALAALGRSEREERPGRRWLARLVAASLLRRSSFSRPNSFAKCETPTGPDLAFVGRVLMRLFCCSPCRRFSSPGPPTARQTPSWPPPATDRRRRRRRRRRYRRRRYRCRRCRRRRPRETMAAVKTNGEKTARRRGAVTASPRWQA